LFVNDLGAAVDLPEGKHFAVTDPYQSRPRRELSWLEDCPPQDQFRTRSVLDSGVANYSLIVPYPGPAVGRMRKRLMNLQVEELDAIRQRIHRIGQLPRPQLRHYVLANSGVAYRIAPVDQFLLVRVTDRRKTSG
jgi:hypothetical protein